MAVSGVLTQGSPYEDRWTSAFLLRYSDDGFSFKTYSSDGSSDRPTELKGNDARNTVARNELAAPVTARYWRLVPTTWSAGGLALRFNLLVCEVRATSTSTGGQGVTPTAVPILVPTLEPSKPREFWGFSSGGGGRVVSPV